MDDRTTDQKSADDQMTTAVNAVVSAYGYLPDGALLQDYVIQGRGIRYDDDGERLTHTFTCFQDGSLDPITIAGHFTAGFFRWGMYAAGVSAEGDEG